MNLATLSRRCHARVAPAAIVALAGVSSCDDATRRTTTPADNGWDGGPVCMPCDAGRHEPDRARDAATGDDAGVERDAGSVGPAGACGDCGACEERMVDVGRAVHREGDIDYADSPPAGGPHAPCWADWGAHADEVRPENWVHNLEHGGVVLLYGCPDGCAAAIAELEAFADSHERALLTPYPDLPLRFAYVSWGFRLLTDCHDLGVVRAFYEAHVGRGPEDATSGPPAACR